MATKVSKEVQEQAMKVAKGTQKPGQTKEQTKLIAQGIEKGIAQYKKQQSQKAREQDKARKQKLKQKQNAAIDNADIAEPVAPSLAKLPWALLLFSWLGFAVYFSLSG